LTPKKIFKIEIFFSLLIFAFFASKSCALDFASFKVRGFEGKGPVEFNSPEDILITTDGRIVVADKKNNRIQILTRDGDFIRFIPQLKNPGAGNDPAQVEADRQNFNKLQQLMKVPTGLALDKEGRLYVSCQDTHKILIIDFESGKLIGTLGSRGSKQGQFNSPMDIDINAEGLIAVAEWRNRRVQLIDQDGICVNEIVYNQKAKNGFKAVAPRGVLWTNENRLLVTYPLFNQVVCWNIEEAKLAWRYGIKGHGRGMLHNPSYAVNGPDGHFLISDTLNHRIVEITRDGQYYKNYSIGKGSAPGSLIDPRGLALNNKDTLVVSDQGNDRIQFFLPGQATILLREVKKLALKDNWEEAVPKIKRILYLQPNNSQATELMVNALYYFGERAFARGEYIKAEENFRKVLHYRPNDPNIPKKLDAIFWASNQGLIANIVFGIIAIVILLILIWILKVLISRYFLSRN
jgi:sugar lactone lactonase YvrE